MKIAHQTGSPWCTPVVGANPDTVFLNPVFNTVYFYQIVFESVHVNWSRTHVGTVSDLLQDLNDSKWDFGDQCYSLVLERLTWNDSFGFGFEYLDWGFIYRLCRHLDLNLLVMDLYPPPVHNSMHVLK